MSALPRSRSAKSLVPAVALLGALMLGSTAAHADASNFTVYTDLASFLAAVPDAALYTFPSGDGSQQPSPYSIGAVNIGSTQHIVKPHLEDDGFYGAGQTYLSMSGPINGVSAGASTSSANGIYSMAFDIGTFDVSDTLTIKMNTTDIVGSFSTFTVGTSTFIGITSTVPITQFNLTSTVASELDFLDVRYGTTLAAAVPEPTSGALSLAGLLALGAFAKRRKAN